MTDPATSILNSIQKHTIKGIPRAKDQIHPNYEGLSIANIPASICRWLGCPDPSARPLTDAISARLQEEYQHVILVLVDGLGLNFLRANHFDEVENNPIHAWKTYLQDGLFVPLTSISPSTTSAALTTLNTGKLPIEHGILAYELFLKEFGLIANMITHTATAFPEDKGSLLRAGFDPQSFLPVQTLGAYLRAHDVQAFTLQHQAIVNSGLSQMILNDTTCLPYQSMQEMWKIAQDIHATKSKKKTFTYIYWSEMDTLSHHTGPEDEELVKLWRAFFSGMDQFLRGVKHKSTSKTLFILTADHGQIVSRIDPDYDLHNHPEFTNLLTMMPSGETRLPILFANPKNEPAIRDYLNSHWNGKFHLLPSDEVIASGLFGAGDPYQGTINRLGQYVVFPEEDAYWWWANKENHLLGRHGGLSQDEMLVPFFALEV
jgi:hypothetical protein